jgi:hypothetical protein
LAVGKKHKEEKKENKINADPGLAGFVYFLFLFCKLQIADCQFLQVLIRP